MNRKSHIILSIITAFTFTLLTGILMYLAVNTVNSEITKILFIVGLLLIFIIQFAILYFVFNKFILQSLKDVYGFGDVVVKNTDKEKDKDKEKEKNTELVDLKLGNILTQVNDDVADWAKDQTKEIALLKANEKYRKEFLGNVSHELKTPLFSIQGYITTLIDSDLEDVDINMKYLKRAETNVTRLIQIVEDLGTIAKLEAGELKLNIENFDIKSSIQDALDLYDIKAKNKNIKLEFAKFPSGEVMCKGDKGKIYEVISNLIVNSINYGNENGRTTVSIFDIETKWLIEIQDNGIGIAEDDLQRVFERFYRVDKSRSSKSGGTGLGLSIVKHIIEAHGELITVRSKINEGTTFSFTLKKAE
ncbi:MAG: ATP-binding protein [Bacteroidales bacterium]|nr:ATP-binding protein [Bacteroidales bacterium]